MTETFWPYTVVMDPQRLAYLESAMKRRLAVLPTRIRPVSLEVGTIPRAFLLTGPRGTGKTTFLLHHARTQNMLYLSADSPMVSGASLYETVRAIFQAGYAGIIIDEVHFARDWSQHLKALYDDYPAHSFWISDSSSLVLRSGVGDLSRRFVPIKLPLLSFREFLFLERGLQLPVWDPFAGKPGLPVEPGPGILESFRVWRTSGTRPFYTEGNFGDRLLAILDKTLYADIPFFLPNVTDGNLRLMKAITATLSEVAIPRLQVRSLCADWNIGAEKLYQILEAMDSVGLLRIIRAEHDTKAMTAGKKLFFADPAMYAVLGGNTGSFREAMVASLCADTGWLVEACNDEKEGDFVLTRTSAGKKKRLVLEVGGKTKKPKHADFVIRDDLDYPAGNAIPLWLLGMSH
mgnify:CR=1 FL=1